MGQLWASLNMGPKGGPGVEDPHHWKRNPQNQTWYPKAAPGNSTNSREEAHQTKESKPKDYFALSRPCFNPVSECPVRTIPYISGV